MNNERIMYIISSTKLQKINKYKLQVKKQLCQTFDAATSAIRSATSVFAHSRDTATETATVTESAF